jgi:class 3 adenylate cyclase
MNSDASILSREDMLALIESGRELSAQFELEPLLQHVLAKASQLTDSPDTSIILNHEERDGLYVAAATGDQAEWVLTTFGRHSAKAIPIEGSKAGQVYETGISIVENKVEDHFKGVDAETKKVTTSMVCVPLSAGAQRIGAMQILNKRSGAYTNHERVLLEHFAAQAAIAIRNARMFESLLAHSGLYTRLGSPAKLTDMVRELHVPAHSERLTILFADMRGFTQLCQTLISAQAIQERLNEFISMLAHEVIACDGMVNKFLGDGVMAIFRKENHAERAVKAAFQIVDRFRGMKARWDDESSQQLDFLDVGVGIVTDEVTIGAIGSDRVRDFTVVGSAVNLAAALEDQARDGRWIVTNHLTYRDVKDQVEAEALEDFVLQKPGQTVGVRHKRYWLKTMGEPRERRLFISHSHLDRAFVQSQLLVPLKSLGQQPWCATDDIPKGALWPAAIRTALSECHWMVVVISENSKHSDWVRLEVDMAIGLGRFSGRIIPVRVDDTAPGDVNEYLVSMQMVEARSTPSVAATIVEVTEASARASRP